MALSRLLPIVSTRTVMLVGVCGAVGAGKSSLLSLLLGQMEVMSGHVECVADTAYVAQQAWILSDTLRNNILLGAPDDGQPSQPVTAAEHH